MASVIDGQDAILGGQAFAEEVWEEFMREWLGPMMNKGLKGMWALLPPQQKEVLKRQDPEKYQQLVSQMESEV